MNLYWLLLLVGIVSWGMTGLLRRYFINQSLIDIPNARSSHSKPTPRGGGVAVVITYSIGLIILWDMLLLDNLPFVGLLGAGLLVAAIGFIDDYGHVAVGWRLLAHFFAAVWISFFFEGLPPLPLMGIVFNMGWVGNLLLVFALVWLINLYNFMDGIDGIAGVEAIFLTVAMGIIFVFVFKHEEIAILHILMSAAVVGFLIWNFPQAKIFMGDAGSGFVGLMLGALALYSAHIEPLMLWVWFILFGVFIVDATYTLIRRLLRGDKIYQAHCSHAYQNAARKCTKHSPVTLVVLAINLLWLLPWSLAVAFELVDGVVGILCSYIPLLWLAWYFHAGDLEKQERS